MYAAVLPARGTCIRDAIIQFNVYYFSIIMNVTICIVVKLGWLSWLERRSHISAYDHRLVGNPEVMSSILIPSSFLVSLGFIGPATSQQRRRATPRRCSR